MKDIQSKYTEKKCDESKKWIQLKVTRKMQNNFDRNKNKNLEAI